MYQLRLLKQLFSVRFSITLNSPSGTTLEKSDATSVVVVFGYLTATTYIELTSFIISMLA